MRRYQPRTGLNMSAGDRFGRFSRLTEMLTVRVAALWDVDGHRGVDTYTLPARPWWGP